MHILILLVFLFSNNAFAQSSTLEGNVTHVRDGDTIEVGKIPIRLEGISAPELKQPMGRTAKDFLSDLIAGRRVICSLNGDTTYDRYVGKCYLLGEDVGGAIVAAGLALDCPRYSGGYYAHLELADAANKINLPRYCRN